MPPAARGQTWIGAPDSDAPPAESDQNQAPAPTDQPAQAPPLAESPDYEQPSVSAAPVVPVYLALHPNINAFTAFSDGGWDGNWYVGYNNCWIVELPRAPRGNYARAYIGARLGRAKTQPRPGRGLERSVIPGKIYLSISSTHTFSATQSYLLALSQELSIEPDPNAINKDQRQAAWYWVEIPLKDVNFEGPNYLALYSPSDFFQSASSAPILGAATTTEKQAHAWLNRSIRGAAPTDPATALETPIHYLLPALALKLVPPDASEVTVRGLTATRRGEFVNIQFSAYGENVEQGWVELSLDDLSWEKRGPTLRQPPYVFTFTAEAFGKRDVYLRGAARDILGNVGFSGSVVLSAANP